MRFRHPPAGGFFHPQPPGIHSRAVPKDIAGCPKKNRYYTGLTNIIPVVLFYTDQKKEKIQIGAWPCPLSFLEIFFFLFKSIIVEEIHIFKFIVQSQIIFFPLGG